MNEIKLSKLPNRVPKKITFSAAPELTELLDAYASIYEKSYGQKESVEELIPFILLSFLQGDRSFVKARKTMKKTVSDSSDGRRQVSAN